VSGGVIYMNIQQLFLEHWPVLAGAAFLIGMDKGGMKPLTIVATFLLTTTFGPRMTLAITAPIMFIGDLFPIFLYRKETDYPSVGRLLPWAFVGLGAGAFVGSFIDERVFQTIIGIIILILAVMIIVQDLNVIHYRRMKHPAATLLLGVSAGFSSIIGNAAGGFASIYFIAHDAGKRSFIGSSAAFFSVVNCTKFVIYIVFWKVVTAQTLAISGAMIPVIIAGTAVTTALIRFVPERLYRMLVIGSVIYAGISLLFSL
jgi:uncharacterized membrane protein YfcA